MDMGAIQVSQGAALPIIIELANSTDPPQVYTLTRTQEETLSPVK
jgi:hypothetical protein